MWIPLIRKSNLSINAGLHSQIDKVTIETVSPGKKGDSDSILVGGTNFLI